MNQPRHLAAWLIARYQQAGGGRRFFAVDCNFTPTCSEFTRLAILDQGIVTGISLGWQRIRRCNNRDLAHKIEDPYSGGTHGCVCRD